MLASFLFVDFLFFKSKTTAHKISVMFLSKSNKFDTR